MPVCHPSLGLMMLAALAMVGQADGKPVRVVTTTTDLMSITAAVGGAHVEVSSISSGRQDPHFVEAKPSYMLKLRKADLFIRIGLQLELAWERLVLEGARNGRIQPGAPGYLDASAGIERLEVPAGPVDRSMGDVHPEGNPHYWLDPYNARIMAGTIALRLGELDPEHAAVYAGNAADFSRRIDEAMFGAGLTTQADPQLLYQRQLDGRLEPAPDEEGSSNDVPIRAPTGGWYAKMAPFRGVPVVTYHRSWAYFFHRFGLVSVGELEPKPGIAPSPGHLKRLIETMRLSDARLVIIPTYKGDRAPQMVASKTGATVVKLPLSVGGSDLVPDYPSLMNHLVTQISLALQQSL